MIKTRQIAALLTGTWLILGNIAHAGEINFELKLKEYRVSPGRQTYCEMIFRDDTDAPVPEAPFVKGLNIAYLRKDEKNIREGEHEMPVTTHTYRIVGLKPGSFTIGPVIFTHNGNDYKSNSVVLEVESTPSLQAEKIAPREKASLDISKHVYLTLDIPKADIFTNERVPVTLNFYSDRFNTKIVDMGRLKGDDLIIEDLYAADSDLIKRDNTTYRIVRYRTALIAPTAGQFVIKPMVIKADLLGSGKNDLLAQLNNNDDDRRFYEQFVGLSGKRTIELNTPPMEVKALPLPREGRPDDFAGAVGDFSFDFSASTAEAEIGEKITLKITISGTGNYSTVSAPRIKKTAGIKYYETRATKGENLLNYEQIIRVQSTDVQKIPEATFSFFNPEAKRYVSITKGPIPIHITEAPPGSAGAAGKIKEPDMKKEWIDTLKDNIYPLRERGTPFYRERSFLLFETLPILIALLGLASYTVARYLEEHPLYTASFIASRKARREIIKAESALNRGSHQEFYGLIFRMLQGYLGTRRLKPVEGITGNIIDEINIRGIEQDVIEKIREIFYECYVARYTVGILEKGDMQKTLDAMIYVVDNLNKKAEL